MTAVALLDDVRALRATLVAAESGIARHLARVRPEHRESVRNLVHYVELRRHDLTLLQDRLAGFGLSTLTRIDADVVAGIDSVIETLSAIVEERPRAAAASQPSPGILLLRDRRRELFGPSPGGRTTRIMVTLPSEAASDVGYVQRLRDHGMDLARVNLAHDDATAWATMARRAHASGALVAMDLGGPKVRTGPLLAGPRVLKVKPSRDADGEVLEPARVRLAAPETVESAGVDARDVPVVPVVGLVTARFAPGQRLRLRDARGAKRKLTITRVTPSHLEVTHRKTVYFATDGLLETEHGRYRIGELPPAESFHLVHDGDTIVLTRALEAAEASDGGVHHIGCTLDAVIDDAEPGDRVFFDDGKLEGVVIARHPHELDVEVRRSRPGGVKLRAEKGINLPDTTLRIPALTAEDRAGLPVVASHADLVNYSFVRTPKDIDDLITALREHGADRVGIVLKIETVEAVRNLPQLLATAMQWPRVGVMIARGDLAVELGFERLAEVQEELLRVCESARVPAIWATQVLDTMARTGLPSRAEVTDAAMGRRAEAVMLNKGPFIDETIVVLADILKRLGDDVSKQRVHLPALPYWTIEDAEPSASSTP